MALPEMYFSVDIEANGPIPGEYSMTSLGCCVVGKSDCSFYVEIKPISDKVVPAAEQVSGLTMDYLREKGTEPEKAIKDFHRWIWSTVKKSHRPVFVGFNATFDWMFTYWYLMKFVGNSPFSISGLDIKAYYMGMLNTTWGMTKKGEVRKLFPTGMKHTHHALDDAREQALLFEKMLDHQTTEKSRGSTQQDTP